MVPGRLNWVAQCYARHYHLREPTALKTLMPQTCSKNLELDLTVVPLQLASRG